MPLFGGKKTFSETDIPDLTGQTILVTGGTSGLGLTSAVSLLKKNAHVIISARNQERGDAAVKEIQSQVPETKGKLEFGIMDQTSLKSVKSFAEWFLKKNTRLEVLLLNAGIALVPFELIHGIESHVFVNHLSHYYLAQLLLPKLKESAPSRIVFVSSEANIFIKDDVVEWKNVFGRSYNGMVDAFKQYGYSKLANVVNAKYLAESLKDNQVYVNAIHPGAVKTNLPSKVPFSSTWFGSLLGSGINLLLSKPETGVLTQLYASTSPEIVQKDYRGEYLVPVGKVGNAAPVAKKSEHWKDLIDLSEEQVQAVLKAEEAK